MRKSKDSIVDIKLSDEQCAKLGNRIASSGIPGLEQFIRETFPEQVTGATTATMLYRSKRLTVKL